MYVGTDCIVHPLQTVVSTPQLCKGGRWQMFLSSFAWMKVKKVANITIARSARNRRAKERWMKKKLDRHE